MSRSDDQKRLEYLKSQLSTLKLEQEQSIERELAIRRAAEKADQEDPISNKYHIPLNLINSMSLSNLYPQKDYSLLIKLCEIEIRELENRLSKPDFQNFMNDALSTAGSIENVGGRWYSYSDKNNGCLKFIILFYAICGFITLIVLLATGTLG